MITVKVFNRCLFVFLVEDYEPNVLIMMQILSGGTFALYSLLCRHAKFNLLPNQQAADEELSSYKYGPSSQTGASSPLKMFLEKHKRLRTVLLVVVLFGACMVIGDGVLSPAISGKVVLSCDTRIIPKLRTFGNKPKTTYEQVIRRLRKLYQVLITLSPVDFVK